MMKARSLEIVTHCFCPLNVTQYAEHLKWQFASLLHFPPPVPTTLSVCFTPADKATSKRVEAMAATVTGGLCKNVAIQTVQMTPATLFRRAIGRNLCAKQTQADVIWFTDVDYLFGPGCLQAVAELVGPDSGLVMPGSMLINYDEASGGHHALGDQMIADNLSVEHPVIDDRLFKERRQRTAIGGVQIVGGNLARRIGYLDGTKYVQPVDPAAGFRSCRCDKWFRSKNDLSAERLPIPNVYRIRHGTDGRDYDLTGQAVGKESW